MPQQPVLLLTLMLIRLLKLKLLLKEQEAAIQNVVSFTPVPSVADIPASPADNDTIEVVDSTGIESFTPLSGLPTNITFNSTLAVRLQYDTNTWIYISYRPNDPESRYAVLVNENVFTEDNIFGANFDLSEENANGVRIRDVGEVVVQKTGGSDAGDSFEGWQGDTKVFNVTADGGAAFAEGDFSISNEDSFGAKLDIRRHLVVTPSSSLTPAMLQRFS